MVFRKVASTKPVEDYLVSTISQRLGAGDQVLWLLSGGSAVGLAVAVAARLRPPSPDRLIVSLADERYGTVGHADSNWQQLTEAGFALPQATLVPVLRGLPLIETAQVWGAEIDGYLRTVDYRLALLGIGPDGHTSGVLPGTPATYATEPAFAYDGGAFERVTTTLPTLARLDEAVVYMVGEAKRQVITGLKNTIDVHEQPAQILKAIHRATIFNDLEGDA